MLAAAQGCLVGDHVLPRLSGGPERPARACRTASLLTLGGFLVASPGLGMRPQLLALPLFAALLWVTAGRVGPPGTAVARAGVRRDCANLHGSFTLFPLDRRASHGWRIGARDRPRRARTLLIAVVTAARDAGEPVRAAGVDLRGTTSSTQPRDPRHDQRMGADHARNGARAGSRSGPRWRWSSILVRRPRPTPWTSLLTLGLFFLLALSAQRAIVWWGMVTPVVLAGLLRPGACGERSGDASRDAGSRLPAYAIIGALVAGVLVLAPWWRGTTYDRFLDAAPPGLTKPPRAACRPEPAHWCISRGDRGSNSLARTSRCSSIRGSRSCRRTSGTTTARSGSPVRTGRRSSTAGRAGDRRRRGLGSVADFLRADDRIGARSTRTTTARCSSAADRPHSASRRSPDPNAPRGGPRPDGCRPRACRRSARGGSSRCARERRGAVAISRAVSPSAATISTSCSRTGQLGVQVAPSLEAIGDQADRIHRVGRRAPCRARRRTRSRRGTRRAQHSCRRSHPLP